MTKANVFEVKAHLSEYLERVERGERVIICRRNTPIAELWPIEAARVEPRPIGGAKGQFVVPASFFDPLPDDVIESFYPGTPMSLSEPPPVLVARETSETQRRAPARRRPRRTSTRSRR